jgi:hypothetical protein
MKNFMDRLNFLRSKKAFLLSLVIPALTLLVGFLENPYFCALLERNKMVDMCERRFESPDSIVEGIGWMILATMIFLSSILAISSSFFILNGKGRIGYVFLVLFILSLLFIGSFLIF